MNEIGDITSKINSLVVDAFYRGVESGRNADSYEDGYADGASDQRELIRLQVQNRMDFEAESVGGSDFSDREAFGAHHALQWVLNML
jgi:hypothetical protein